VQAVPPLNDRSYHLIFVGAPNGREQQVGEKRRGKLTVGRFIANRENQVKLLCEANLAVIPSRTERFGLTALEALSAFLPFLNC